MKIGNFLIAKFQTLVVITIHDTVTRRNVHFVSAGEYCKRNIYFKCKLTLSEYESEIDSRHYINIKVEV